ncbi:monocarboxylate permease [Crepidotus variabilis]|uniref:Monocarboxylate permease n=1 Tax=Crepidotus variabilis TaxID=179855 RepID=A0A9P6E7Z7_9AGAR|nr:monocarboxylate permease [Crepidotus variabilis]
MSPLVSPSTSEVTEHLHFEVRRPSSPLSISSTVLHGEPKRSGSFEVVEIDPELLETLKQTDLFNEKAGAVDEEAPPSEFPIQTLPEGGWKAWLTVIGAYINSFGIYDDYYVRVYLKNYTPSDIGWIGGIQIFLTFSCGAFSGRLFDKGYLYVFFSKYLFSLSLTHENAYYQVFLSHGVTLGLASGLSYVPTFGIAGHYFSRKRPFVVGLISSGSALGSVLNPLMLNKLFNGPMGFHNGVRISAAINTFLMLVALLIMRTNLPPKQAQPYRIRSWLKEPAYLCLLLGVILVFFGLFYPVFTIQLYAMKHGVSPSLAFYSTSILNASSFFGRVIPGLFTGLLGTLNLGAFMTISSGVIVLCMASVTNATGTILFSIFFGFFQGGAISLTPAIVAHLAKDPTEIGTRMGVVFALGGFVGLFAMPISGVLLTEHYNWVSPMIFAGVTIIASGLFYGLARFFYGQGKPSLWL